MRTVLSRLKHLNAITASPQSPMLFVCLIVGATLLSIPAIVSPAWGQVNAQSANEGELPVSLAADEMSYDREHEIITARGNVEVAQQGRTLLADVVSYDKKKDLLTATGNIVLHEPGGEVVFANYAELTGDLKNGIIKDMRAVLVDASRIAANSATMDNKSLRQMNQAVYSPCKPCEKDPSRPPLWQLKAVKVIHDTEAQTVYYKHAWMEIGGIPVIYTPYFSHPDPSVKRKSGFLTPSFGGSSELGSVIKTPYFFAISPHRDATITPIYTSNEGLVMSGQYRERTQKGEFNFFGSATQNSNQQKLGHVEANIRYHIDDTWRLGLDAKRTNNDTYLRRYSFGGESVLVNHAYAEGFRGRNYASVDTYHFQDLRAASIADAPPLVVPLAEFHHVGEPDPYGGRSSLNASVMALERDDGTDTRRISVQGGWFVPYVAPAGDVYTLSANLRGDLYNVSNYNRGAFDPDYSGNTYRVRPEIAMNWQYPLVKADGPVRHLVEPMASFVISPYGGNPDTIPNEDSQDFEFDEVNLFQPGRYAGLDRVDGGPRVNYGMRWGIYGDQGGSTSLTIGQSYRLKKDKSFSANSGLQDKFSDIVAGLQVSPGKYVDLLYRTRLNKDNLTFRRNEARLTAGVPKLSLSANYLYFPKIDEGALPGREEISGTISSQFTNNWRGSISAVYDMHADGGLRSMVTRLTYADECFQFHASLNHNLFKDRDIKPDQSILFTLVFKNLGAVSTAGPAAN